MRAMMPFVPASLIAPLTTPLLYCVGSLSAAIADPVRRAYVGHNVFTGAAVVFIFGGPVAYAATFAALVALWVMGRFGPLTMTRTVVVGAVVGVGVATALGPSLHGDLISVPLAAWHGGVLGAATAAVWWRLARRACQGNPHDA